MGNMKKVLVLMSFLVVLTFFMGAVPVEVSFEWEI
jgi:hypothetical protein